MARDLSGAKLLSRARDALKTHHYRPRTRTAYLRWIARFIDFHRGSVPASLESAGLGAFIRHLRDQDYSTGSQHQAISAVNFVYRSVVGVARRNPLRSGRTSHSETVATRAEIQRMLGRLSGVERLVASLLYGSGLTLTECLRLRINDVDFGRRQLRVRSGSRAAWRATVLPHALEVALVRHMREVRRIYEGDVPVGAGFVPVPGRLGRDFPSASRAWAWQWLFPGDRLYTDRNSGETSRGHLSAAHVGRAIRQAALLAGVETPISPRTLRRAFAAHLVEDGCEPAALAYILGFSAAAPPGSPGGGGAIGRIISPLDRRWEIREVATGYADSA